MFEHKKIKNKDIYIVEDHHHVLEPWAIYRTTTDTAPILVTLDHHTDCHLAFLAHCYNQYTGESDEIYIKRDKCREICVEHINYNNLHSVQSAIENLRFDEHIDTAIKSTIIKKAFVISYQGDTDKPMSFKEEKRIENFRSIILAELRGEVFEVKAPEGYPDSKDGMYIIGAKCWIGDETENHDQHNNDCEKKHFDQAIESIYLKDKLNIINKMVPGLIENNQFTQDYILDIDLDYFHTVNSIHPNNHDIFYNLIKNAKIITIATEPICVELEKYEGEDINSVSLLTTLLNHIEKALS